MAHSANAETLVAVRLDALRVDPRIDRTRRHVLDTARRMLAEHIGLPMTFSTLSAEAQVSRRTLYTHWGDIESVIRDGGLQGKSEAPDDFADLPPRQKLEIFLARVQRELDDPVVYLAFTSLLTLATTEDPAAVDEIKTKRLERITEFRELIGAITDDEYLQILGPIVFHRMVQGSARQVELLGAVVDRACAILGFSDSAAAAA